MLVVGAKSSDKNGVNKLPLASAHDATMTAGITGRLWSLDEIAERIEANRPQPGKRGPYKKRIVS